VNIPASQRIPRHIVIVSLETAPRKFYPIADNPMLPVFHAMSQHALVSDRHYASAPATSLAIYSLMTGTYPRPGEAVSRYGPFETDGLPTVLARHGYESTFIDSYDLSWNGQEDDAMLRSLGFSTIVDSRQLAVPKAPDAYTYRVRQEARSFDAALDAIRGAASRGRKALVFVATILGHYDWVSPPGTAKLSAAEKLAETARVIDGLMGKFLTSLAQQGLADDMLIVVTGDHGLRFKLEFESLHEPAQYSDATFNVPFMVYAPALFPSQVRLPYSTSHVDLAPTLLDLVGVTRDGGLYHGDDMLDRRLESRVTFLPSGLYPGLHPVDGFCWRDSTYSVYSITHRVTVRVGGNPISRDFGAELEAPFSADDARRMVGAAKELFNATAAEFLRRRAQRQ